MNRERLEAQLFMLRATVTYPWESVDQLLREHADRPLGDASVPGTGAWHLRHIVEIFRLHARTTMLGLGAEPAAVEDLVQRPDAAIAALPPPARDGLLSELDAFSAWTLRQSDEALARRFTYGSETDLESMLVCMSVHITWHAAAVHYWVK